MKNNLVLIIGINGVGKEHIRACNSLKIPYVLYDINILDFRNKKFVWNIWGSHKEKIQLNYLKSIHDNYKELLKYRFTHCIIAVPDIHHQKYVDQIKKDFPNIKILVEKPSLCNTDLIDYIGYTDFNLKNIERIDEIQFEVEHVERSWNNHIAEDLLGHLYYSYLIAKKEFIKIKKYGEKINYVEIILENDIKLSAKRECSDTCLVIDGIKKHNDYEKIFKEQIKNYILYNNSNKDYAIFVEQQIEGVR